LDKNNRVLELAKHNLYVSFSELNKVKQAIYDGSLWELVEQRAHSHPYLLEALAPFRDKENKIFLEKFEPLSRKRFLYLGTSSLHRPDVYRYETRFFKRYSQPSQEVLIGFDMPSDPENTYSQHYLEVISQVLKKTDAHFMVASIFGPVPLDLDEMYPVGQAVVPSGDELKTVPDIEKRIRRLMEKFSHGHKYGLAVMWDGKDTLELLELGTGRSTPIDPTRIDLQRVRSVANMQFGYNAGDQFFSDESSVKLIKSKRTGKIRNVILNGDHILSLRAQDGFFTLKAQGAKILHEHLKPPALRVVVNKDSEEFNREGKNVFAKFVIDCDPEIRPMDEVMVVNEKDELIAVGRAVMNREEILAFDIGIAVKVREVV
jgi:7-cyano-7-deazaguanine tRNA-ribosyltransferase